MKYNLRPGESVQEYAMRHTCLLIKSDIPAKYLNGLQEYINTLDKKELNCYINIANDMYDRRTVGNRSLKVSLNAIKLCLKLHKLGHKTFPYICKLATKGWDTAGGTYAFSMPSVHKGDLPQEYFSFGPIEKLIKSDAELDVFYNQHNRCTEIDYR